MKHLTAWQNSDVLHCWVVREIPISQLIIIKKIHAPGITVIGAHTIARPEKESHPGWFTHRDDIKATLKLCSGGRINLESLIEETHSPKECQDVYNRLIFDKDFPVVVQFDWRNVK